MGKLDFSIAINLLTDNFKRGANEVKSGFAQMKSQILGLAGVVGLGGIGITALFSKMLSTSKEVGRGNVVLKNASNGLQDYTNNLNYCNSVAKKYGIYIADITQSYAKFSTAANGSNIPISTQRSLFEALIISSKKFGQSSDQTSSLYDLMTRMMAKGIVKTRDLRAIVNQIPNAYQAMAIACGTSTKGLDALLKKGIDANKVLPQFAAALKALNGNANLDTAGSWTERLKNSFAKASTNSNFLDVYKSGIKSLVGLVDWAANNIKSIIGAVIAYFLASRLSSIWGSFQTGAKRAYGIVLSEARKASIASGEAFDKVAWKAENGFNTIKYGAIKAGAAIKSAFLSMLPTAIMTGVFLLIEKFVQLQEEATRIKNKFSQIKSEGLNSGSSEEIVKLKELRDIATNIKNSTTDRKNAINEINRQLGTNYSLDAKSLRMLSAQNGEYEKRLKILQATATVEWATQKKLELEDNIRKKQIQLSTTANSSLPKNTSTIPWDKNFSLSSFWNGPTGVKTIWNLTFGGIKDMISQDSEIKSDKKSLEWVNKLLKDNLKDASKGSNFMPSASLPDTKKKKETELEKAYDKYISDLKKLGEQLKQGDINQADYNVAVDKLNKETLTNLAGLKQKGVKNSPFYQDLKVKTSDKGLIAQHELDKVESDYSDKVDDARKAASKGAITQNELSDKLISLANESSLQALSIKNIGNAADGFVKKIKGDLAGIELSKVESDYADKIDEQKGLLATGQISTEAYNNAVAEAAKDAAEAAAKIKNIGNQANEFIKNRKKDQQKATVKPRDTTFDYSKTQYDIASEKYDQHIETLKAQFGELSEQVRIATTNADDFKQAMNLAKINEDIKDYKKQLGLLGGDFKKFESVKDGVEGIYNAWDNLKDSFKENPFKGLLSALDAFTTTIDTIDSTISALEEVAKVMDALSGAQKAKEAITVGTEAASSAAVASGATAHVAAKVTEIAANEAAQVSAQGLMAAESAAAYAAIPFVGAGLAAAQIASMMAMIQAAQIPMFATGGIVGGASYTGDKVLARVNSGEMILNSSQQSRLFKAINGGGISGDVGINSIVTSKVRGSDLLLTINNELKRRGKKPL